MRGKNPHANPQLETIKSMRHLTLTALLALSLAGAQSAPTPVPLTVTPAGAPVGAPPAVSGPVAEPVRIPETGELARPAGIISPVTGITLRQAVGGLTTVAGYTLVAPDLPNLTLTGLVIEPRVSIARTLELLLNTYAPGLAAVVLEEQGVLLVARPEVVARVVGGERLTLVTTALSEAQLQRLTAAGALRAAAVALGDGLVLLSGTAAQREDSAAFLREVEAALPRAAAQTPGRTELFTLDSDVSGDVSALAGQLREALNVPVRAVGRTLIVTGDEATIRTAGTLIARLPRTAAPPAAPQSAEPVRVTLEAASPEEVARLLTAMLPEGSRVTPLPALGLVAVVGSEDAVALARRLTATLPAAAAAATTPVTRRFPSRDVAGDARYLRALLPGVEVVELDADGEVVVRGSAEVLAQAQALLLERPGNVGGVTRFYNLTGGAEAAAVIAQAIRREVEASTTLYGTVLAVRGTEEQQRRTALLLETFQRPEVREPTITRSIRLNYADPAAVLAALTGLGAIGGQVGGATVPAMVVTPPAPQGQGVTLSAVVAPGQTTQATPAQTPPVTPGGNAPAGGALVGEDALTLRAAVDERTGAILLRGPQGEVESAAQAIAFLDVRQELIRVRVRVEQMTDTALNSLGFNWTASAGPLSVSAGGGGLSAGVSNRFTLPTLGVQLQALAQQGHSETILDTNFISTSGQATEFLNGGTLVFPPQPGGSGAGNYQYGVGLNFTPRLRPDGTIAVTLETTIGQPPAAGAQGAVLVTEQRIRTVADLRPGEVTVLGGALTVNRGRDNGGVPVLSRLPIIGGLFRSETVTNRRENLVFIVTAEVVGREPLPAGRIEGGERVILQPGTAAPTVTVPAPPATPVTAPVTVRPAPAPTPSPAPAAPRNTGTERTTVGGTRP